jgi:hypothetical protein
MLLPYSHCIRPIPIDNLIFRIPIDERCIKRVMISLVSKSRVKNCQIDRRKHHKIVVWTKGIHSNSNIVKNKWARNQLNSPKLWVFQAGRRQLFQKALTNLKATRLCDNHRKLNTKVVLPSTNCHQTVSNCHPIVTSNHLKIVFRYLLPVSLINRPRLYI